MSSLRAFVQAIQPHANRIVHASMSSWNRIDFNQHEPDILLEYLSGQGKGVDYLNEHLAAPLTRETDFVVKFCSILAHQKPRVHRTRHNQRACVSPVPQSCELGDLIIQFLLIDQDKKPMFMSALILQAKKGLSPDNLTQQCLYEHDDRLIFPNYFGTPNEECLLPGYEDQRTHALAYLFLQDSFTGIGQIPNCAALRFPYSHLFLKILTTDFGKQFQYAESNFNNDWDKLISKVTLKLAESTYRGTNRVVGLDFFLEQFNDYYYHPEYLYRSEAEGLNIIQIIVQPKKKLFDSGPLS
ncbi:MAG TPA: hypothetical protein PKL56_11545 [Cyclobacteriaceae bacterium]|nr:hypothetical protein [Cyclobacteriaceae bacterium]HMV07427.1 hypothetical protein [Cyclobacteriaceae bacterium]HMV88969.1 hypothetical protein [Cyclobacteriaceae bacterium]HMW99218.1 hypothetical protein [Cyclobacteriaceae bacterium]HMX48993.1 hypothetical protein [Cyclobacteriaceae bacterium]